MSRFSANLGFLFADLPFLDRFAAAAAAGFRAVEYMAPYAHDPHEIASLLADLGLTQALFNLPAGEWEAGERGMAILPDRVGDFRDSVARALDYAEALGCKRLNCLAGIAPPNADRRTLEATLIDNLVYNSQIFMAVVNSFAARIHALSSEAESMARRYQRGSVYLCLLATDVITQFCIL